MGVNSITFEEHAAPFKNVELVPDSGKKVVAPPGRKNENKSRAKKYLKIARKRKLTLSRSTSSGLDCRSRAV